MRFRPLRPRPVRAVRSLVLVARRLRCAERRPSPAARAAGKGATLRVGLVFDVGGRGDKSFNDAAYAGLERAQKELGVRVERRVHRAGRGRRPRERAAPARRRRLRPRLRRRLPVLRRHPRGGAGVPGQEVRVRGLHVPEGETLPPNLVALKFQEEEGSLPGRARSSGWLTKTNEVGFVGGMEIPLIKKFEAGYRAGVQAGEPGGDGATSSTPASTGNAFKNPTKGKELALAIYGAGADIIFHASGSTGLGVFEAAREKGTARHRRRLRPVRRPCPGRVLTSMVKRVDVAVFDTIEDQIDGTLPRRQRTSSASRRRASTTSTTSTTGRSSPTTSARRSRPCAPRSCPARSSPPPSRSLRAASSGGFFRSVRLKPPIIEIEGIVKAFGDCVANDRRLAHRRGRDDPRAGRRERRGQDHADEDPLRPLPARRGRDPHRRRGRRACAPPPTRSPAASAWCTSTSCWCARSPSPRTSCWAASRRRGPFARPRARRGARCAALSERYGLRRRSATRASRRSRSAQQQRVEILKALYHGARILILDEPTAVLTPQEVDELFAVLRELKAAGTTIVLITHKLRRGDCDLADRVTVMRDGRSGRRRARRPRRRSPSWPS